MNTATQSLICLCFALFCSGVPLVPTSAQVTRETRPNIILILTDDQGWGDLSVTGNANLHTPNIDQLSENGATFQYFYVSPVCSPTRAEILTGRYHPRGGVYGTSTGSERLDLDEITFVQLLQEAGYHTGAFGKWHNGMQYPYHPNGRGFDEFYGFCSGHWGDYFSPILEHNGKIIQGEGYLIDDFTDKAIQFMDDHRESPFFVYLPYNTPHRPMQVPDRWWNPFAEKQLAMRHRTPDKEDVLHTRAALAMCENIDWNVGRIMDRIRQWELEEETIIIFLSDNGPNGDRWNGGMKGKKGSTDEGGVRSPAFIQWKGKIRAGLQVNQISGGIDLFPTLLDLAKVDYKSDRVLDGCNLGPLLLEEDVDWPDRYLFSHWNGRVSVRSQHYRLDHEDQLFNLETDPGQYDDIARKLPEQTWQMMNARDVWEMQVMSELPQADRRPFPVGHPDFLYTQLPARDGIAYGNIQRSNRWPNCSFYTNWTSIEDSISWDADVVKEGWFKVEIYYTCPSTDVGSTFTLKSGGSLLEGKITEPHDPPLRGMEHDRHRRGNSYVKDFKPMEVGRIHLVPGRQTITLKATDIPGAQVMDFRLMMLTRVIPNP